MPSLFHGFILLANTRPDAYRAACRAHTHTRPPGNPLDLAGASREMDWLPPGKLPITLHFAATLMKRRRTPGSPWPICRGKQRRTEHRQAPTFAFQLGSVPDDLRRPPMLVSNARWTTSIHTFDPYARERCRVVAVEGQRNVAALDVKIH